MTKTQCYSEINRYTQLIAQYQKEIVELEREVEELNTTESKVSNMKSTLTSCKQTSIVRLANTSIVNIINKGLVSRIFSRLDDLFSGNEYSNVFMGLGKAVERIQEEIYNKKHVIKERNSDIDRCRTIISDLRREIARIEAEERAAALRAAALEAAKNLQQVTE